MTTREELTEAALAVLERDGLEALSMRKVAAELGVQAASLYWHVRNKEELLDLLADAVFRDLDLSPPPGDWRAQISAGAHRYREFLLTHRDVARLISGRIVVGPHSARAQESVLGVLRRAGFSRDDALHTLYLVLTVYVQGFVLLESVPIAAAKARGQTPTEAMASVGRRLAALPAEEFPTIHDSINLMTMRNVDGRFTFGLECIMDGLELRLKAGGAQQQDR